MRQDLTNGVQSIESRTFTSGGVLVGAAGNYTQVSNNGANDAPSIPSVTAFADGSYIVVWENVNFTTQPNGTSEIYAQRFSSAGSPVHQDGVTAGVSNFVVNTTTAGNQDFPDVTVLNNGNFVVAWGSSTQDSDGSPGVFYKVYSANGSVVHAEAEANIFTSGAQSNNSVAALGGGGFAVAWASSNQVSGSSFGDIYVRLFDSGGNATTGEVLVNTATAGQQDDPNVTALPDGGFLVQYSGLDADGSKGVLAQRFSAAGAKVGSEFGVTQTTAGAQDIHTGHDQNPAALLNFTMGVNTQTVVITWDGQGGGDADGIYARQFELHSAPGGTDTSKTILEEGAYTFGAADFGFVDSLYDTPADALSAVILTTLPAHGSLKNNGVILTAGAVVSVADITAGKLVFSTILDGNGPGYGSFTFQVQDTGGTANGSADTDPTPNTFTITVTAVNDAPVVVGGGAATLAAIAEDAAPAGATVSNLFASHFDDSKDNQTAVGGSGADAFAGVAVTVDGASAAQGAWQWSSDGTTWHDLVAASTAAAILVAASDRLRFLPASNYSGSPPGLTVHLADASAGAITSGATASLASPGGTSAYSIGTVTLTETVTAVNDAPVVVNGTSASLPTILEDAAAQPSDSVANLFGGHFDDSADNQVANGGGAANLFAGIALSFNGSSASTGVWQYLSDGGSNWVAVGTVSTASAKLIHAADLLRFVPAPDANGAVPILTAHLVEDSLGPFTDGMTVSLASTGGATPYSAGTIDLSQTITPVNDPPSFTLGGAQTVNEDAPAQTVSGFVTAISPGPANESGQTVAFTLTNTNNGLFSVPPAIAPDGTLTYTLAPNVSGSAVVSSASRCRTMAGRCSAGWTPPRPPPP